MESIKVKSIVILDLLLVYVLNLFGILFSKFLLTTLDIFAKNDLNMFAVASSEFESSTLGNAFSVLQTFSFQVFQKFIVFLEYKEYKREFDMSAFPLFL